MTSELIIATKNGDLATVQELLAQGVDPKFCDEEGRNPLHYAVLEGKNIEIKTVIKTAHYIELISYEDAIDEGTHSQDYASIVTLLIESGFDCNSADKYGYTPLLYAARCTNKATAISLLQAGAQVPQNNQMINNFLKRFEDQDLNDMVAVLTAAVEGIDGERELTIPDDLSPPTQVAVINSSLAGEDGDAGIIGLS